MSDQATARTRPPADGLQALRLLALAAVAAGVGLLAAAAFVLSYTGIHAVALYAGVPPRLARIYPLIFDAMLIVACAAVLSLRGAGLPSRCYAWLSMLVLVVTAATADTLHAIGTRLPHKPTAAAVAIIPWALVLIGFGLLLCMLRQARLRQAAADEEEGLPESSGQAEVAAGLDALFGPKQSGFPQESGSSRASGVSQEPGVPQVSGVLQASGVPQVSGVPQEPGVPQASGVPQEPAGAEESSAEAAGTTAPQEPSAAGQPSDEAAGAEAPVPAEAEPAADSTVDLAIDTEPVQDDPASDEGSAWTPRALEEQPAGVGPGYNGGSASAFSPAPTMPVVEAGTSEPEAETEAEAKTRPEPEAKTEPEAKNKPEPEAEAGPEPGADPEPVLAASAQFGRRRSSPLPPGA
jgi:Protein of unknown function (DUF2637)